MWRRAGYVRGVVFTVQYTVGIIHYTVDHLQYTLYSIQFIVGSIPKIAVFRRHFTFRILNTFSAH